MSRHRESPAEAPRASRRAVCRARLDPTHPPKRYERAARPVSSRSDTSEPSGSTPGPSRPNHPLKRHERAVGQAAGPASNRNDMRQLSGKPPGPPRTETTCAQPSGTLPSTSRTACAAARAAAHTVPPPSDPSCKSLPVGAADTEPNPLDYSL